MKDGSIEAVNLANNHSMDFLEEGFADTHTALRDAGIATFGEDAIAIFRKNGISIGLIGINTLGPLEQGRDIENIKMSLEGKIKNLKTKTSLVVVSFHWGTENKLTPDQEQIDLGRYAIDLGADLVLGHHPHVIQKHEIYKGKSIIYSLGNFVFGGNFSPKYKDTMIVQQTFHFDNGILTGSEDLKIIPCNLNKRYQPNIN